MLYEKQFSLIYRIIIACLFRMLDEAYFNSEICYLQALKRLNIRSKVRNVDTLTRRRALITIGHYEELTQCRYERYSTYDFEMKMQWI